MCALNNSANSMCSDVAYAYWNDICDIKPLSLDEQKRLIKLIKRGDKEANDIFVESFLRLVVSRAKKYCYDFNSFLDMVQEGNLGLLQAIEHFDPDKDIMFSTYATPWIDKYIRRESCRTGRPIYIPENIRKHANHLFIAEAEFSQIHQRKPTIEELAEIMHMTLSQVTDLLSYLKPTLSLDKETSQLGDDTMSLLSVIPDSNAALPEEVLLAKDTKKILEEFMKDNLSEIEFLVLKMRFGLTPSGNPETLQAISEKSGISQEGVRKAEARAIRKLQKTIFKTGLTMADFV